jgi:hypothetical protein
MIQNRQIARYVPIARQGRVLWGDLGEPRIVPTSTFDVA